MKKISTSTATKKVFLVCLTWIALIALMGAVEGGIWWLSVASLLVLGLIVPVANSTDWGDDDDDKKDGITPTGC